MSTETEWPATRQKWWSKPALRAWLTLTCRYEIIGQENLPSAPYVIVCNHMSYYDIPAMKYAIPIDVIGFAARKYKGTWRQPLFDMFALIWVTQFSADREALKAGLYVLTHGGSLAIAPEGTRSRTGSLIQGTDGAAYLATRANVPIVPGAVWGTEKVLKHPRPKVVARIGKPFRLPEGRAKGDQLSVYTEQIMCAIAALLPEEYHGVYAGNPLIEDMAKRVL